MAPIIQILAVSDTDHINTMYKIVWPRKDTDLDERFYLSVTGCAALDFYFLTT